MNIWQLERATIAEIVHALSSESAALPSNTIKQQILAAIWRGEFEHNGNCAVSLPSSVGAFQRQPSGDFASVSLDAEGRECLPPQSAFTREDFRRSLGSGELPSFDLLATWPLARYGQDWIKTHVDEACIETADLKLWLEKSDQAPVTPLVKMEKSVDNRAQPAPRNKPRGRPRGSGSLAEADLPRIEKMHKWLQSQPNGTSITKAAGRVVNQAAGNGTIESKERRLVRRYKEFYPEQ